MRILAIAIVATMLSGCFSATAVSNRATTGTEQTKTMWYAPWGWTSSSLSGDECPYGFATVNNKARFVDLLITGITAGIGARSTLTYTCAEPEAGK